MCKIRMSNNNGLLHLLLRSGDDPVKAWGMFAEFVKSTGGNDVNINDDRGLFHLWENLDPRGDVLFTRSAYGPNGVMTATVVKITDVKVLENPMKKK